MARVNHATIRLLREVGLPDVTEEELVALTERLHEALVAEQTQEQIGADPSRNIGGGTWPDVVEDGGPVMLDNIS